MRSDEEASDEGREIASLFSSPPHLSLSLFLSARQMKRTRQQDPAPFISPYVSTESALNGNYYLVKLITRRLDTMAS